MKKATPVEALLDRPIAWKSAERDETVAALLGDLQANILKGHGREHTRHAFLSFAGADATQLRRVLRKLGETMPSARHQLEETEKFKLYGTPGSVVTCFFLTARGYEKLGIAAPAESTAFAGGMKSARDKLDDSDPAGWDAAFTGEIDAMLLVADVGDPTPAMTEWLDRLRAVGAQVLGSVEVGLAQKIDFGSGPQGVEHFGYVDGRSQPLFLAEDVEAEPRAFWDPAFPPRQFLVHDPNGGGDASFGSFFVFRKLEQHVDRFKKAETALAEALGLENTPFDERAGALVVGRFEDGTPVVENPLPSAMPPVNDFDFRTDLQGSRCPFRAHIRKTNPRGESPAHLARDNPSIPAEFLTHLSERGHIMARRGITYGAARDFEEDEETDSFPDGGVGLLFMAYMASIADQFEFTQATWANNPNFVTGNVGIDPIIGQGDGLSKTEWTDGWSGNTSVDAPDFRDFLTLKGGEYFFAPSLSFLKGL